MISNISCPGNVMIIGAYTSEEPFNSALVMSTPSARFRTEAKLISDSSNFVVTVYSPQFMQSLLYFDPMNQITQTDNQYVDYSVFMTFQLLKFLKCPLPTTCRIQCTLNADKAFYDMSLGSSAALVTSLISAIVNLFSTDDTYLHYICQYTHYMVQGKKGLGQDVASAMYGDIILNKRFEFPFRPKRIDPRQDMGVDFEQFKLDEKYTFVYGHIPFSRYSTEHIVKKWKQKNPDTWNIWVNLNEQLITLFKQQKYDESLRNIFRKLRALLREVPIETNEQTKICDETMEHVPGVLISGGVIGGVFAIVLKENKENVASHWKRHSIELR